MAVADEARETREEQPEVPVEEKQAEPGSVAAEKRYRGMFTASTEDLILYSVCIAGGLWCMYLARNSPTYGFARVQKMKWPKTQQPDALWARFIGWWLLTVALAACGGASTLIGIVGVVMAAYRLVLAALTFVRGLFVQRTAKQKDD
ncbi:hypothetical protein DIPPA_27305 [Diplonema papillatum]|nr:hypothetical protein DIPPA_27305 [Diplonema papillatum]